MNRLRLALQLALGALIACAGGAVLLFVLLALARVAAKAAAGAAGGILELVLGAIVSVAAAIPAGGLAIGPALSAGWLPAVFAGSALTWLGRERDWARRGLAWSLAGAGVALACYLHILPLGPRGRSLLDLFALPGWALPAAFLLAGAAAGRIYRSAIAATAPFLRLDEEDCGP